MSFKSLTVFCCVLFALSAYAQSPIWQNVARVARADTVGASSIEALLVPTAGVCLAATDKGIFRSSDAGKTWSAPWGAPAGPLLRHPDGRIFAGSDAGLHTSTNQGLSWDTIKTHPAVQVCRIARDSLGRMFTAVWGSSSSTGRGVYRSTDNGATWANVVDTSWCETVEAFPGNILYAGGYTWLRRSTDGGQNWQLLYNRAGIRSVTITPSGSVLFGWYAFDAGWNLSMATYRSTDNGISWASVAGFFSEFYAKDSNNAVYAACDSGMRKTTDNGSTWAKLNAGLINRTGALPWLRTLLRTGGSTFLAGEYHTGEVFQSTDLGAHWSTVSTVEYTQPTSPAISALAVKNPATLFVGSEKFGMSRWKQGEGAVSVNSGLSNLAVNTVHVGPGGDVFAGTTAGLFKSTNDGSTWARLGTSALSFRAITELSTGEVLAGLSNAIVKFTSDGTTMSVLNTGLVNKNVNVLITSNNTSYAGTNDGLYRLDSITWTPIPISPGAQKVIDIKVAGHVLAAATRDSGIFVSTDDGQHWQQTGTTGLPVRSIVLLSQDLYIATESNGIYRGTTGGAAWSPWTSGIDDQNMRGLVPGGDGNLYSIAYSGGLFKASLVNLDEGKAGIPVSTVLQQNYPNPFNPMTTIEYAVAGARDQGSGVSEVKLAVYDILGREVAVLVNEKRAPGAYTVKFDASALSSGLYLYRLTAGEFVQTRKMAVVK